VSEPLIESIINMGHHSVLEHVSVTFGVDEISRVASHQLVRHRVGISFSQQSQRYVEYNNVGYVTPRTIKSCMPAFEDYVAFVNGAIDFYKALTTSGIPAEDARYVLPSCIGTNITMTINARELIEICKLRLCKTAQKEIRDLLEMVKVCIANNKELSFLSKYLTPKCDWLKHCPEGKRSCGKYQATESGD